MYFGLQLATYVSMVSPDVQLRLRKTGLDQNIKLIFIRGIILTSWQMKFGLDNKTKPQIVITVMEHTHRASKIAVGVSIVMTK
jgi:hypothetical protein